MKRNNDYKRKFRKKSDEKEESIISKRNQNETVELNNHSMKKKNNLWKGKKNLWGTNKRWTDSSFTINCDKHKNACTERDKREFAKDMKNILTMLLIRTIIQKSLTL